MVEAGVRLLICCSLLFTPLPALAEDTALAKQYYKLGEELYTRADYAGALNQFKQAYAHSRRPALLYNMARCREMLGQHEDAIDLYTQYLRSKPQHSATIEARIINLRELVKQRQAPSTMQAPPHSTPSTPQTGQDALVSTTRSLAPTDSRDAATRRRKTILGAVAAATGAALVITGATLLGVGRRDGTSAHDSYLQATDPQEIARLHGDVHSANTKIVAGYVLLGASAAALGYSLYELLTRPSVEETRHTARATVAPLERGALFSVAGRF